VQLELELCSSSMVLQELELSSSSMVLQEQ
jgi:hypothetical protein